MEAVESPNQVRNAVALLWSSLILTTVHTVASTDLPEDGFDLGMAAVWAIVIYVNGYLIYLVSRRENWARRILLFVTVAVVAATLFWPPEIGVDAWWSVLLLTVSVIADAVAMIWLFSGAGHAWFKVAKDQGAF